MSWNKDQILVLIEAYRNEPALYALKHQNYHNKHLRNEALQRIVNEVQKVRPNTEMKECMNKIHSLRNGFNLENKKRRESMKSGSGTDDIYKPNLWYFNMLTFLEEHFVPRKSICTKIEKNNNEKQVISNISLSDDSQGTSTETDVNETLEAYTILIDENEYSQSNQNETLDEKFIIPDYPVNVSNEVFATQISDLKIVPCNAAPTLSNKILKTSLSDLSATSSSLDICTSNNPPKRQKFSNKKDVAILKDNTLDKIITTLSNPVVLPPMKEKDSIDLGMEFVISMLRKIIDEKEQDKLMSDIIALVMSRKN